MTIMLMHACAQVELSVRDIRAARSFMQDALGACLAEQQLVREIRALFPEGSYDVEHLSCGEALFQFNEPSAGLSYDGQKVIHQVYLDRVGPCVTNLNYFVDDAEHARDLLTAMGAKIAIQGPSSASPSMADYGPDNTRPGADARNFYFIGSRELIGLDLEMLEPNFYRFSQQAVQYPCFVRPRPQGEDENLKLLRLRVVVPDIEQTYANLVTIFSPACRSNPYAVREGELARSFRLGLGGIELEYCEPRAAGGSLAQFLDQYGPGVMTVEFGARDLNMAVEKARRGCDLAVTPQSDVLGFIDPGEPIRFLIGSRDLVGFDVTLEQLDELKLGFG